MIALSAEERQQVTEHVMNRQTQMLDLITLRSALRDIQFGAQMMQGTGDPNSTFNRYCAEVERVASVALSQVRS